MKCYRCGEWDGEKCACKDGQTIFHGDCREILRGIPDESIDSVWTDPPYGHSNQDGDLQSARVRDQVNGARKRDCVVIAGDDSFDVVDASLAEIERILRTDCCCCCCCCCGGGGPKPTFATLANRMDSGRFSFFHAVVWDKSDRGHGLGWRFRRNYEFVMVAHKRGGRLLWAEDAPAVPNIQRIMPPRNDLHPTTKPIELPRRFIEWTGAQTVLDPFMGSGTTLRACKDLGRRGIGIEIEEKYCEIAAERLRQGVLL
jgi:site-specific DNA-methyltransferase (adenine-specific)